MTFKMEKPLTIPVNYQHLLQAFIYQILPEEDATFLHKEGYPYEKRVYKGFTFSQIKGKSIYHRKAKTLTFEDEISISFSSFKKNLIEQVANRLLFAEKIDLHGVPLNLKGLLFDEHKLTK